MDLGLRTCRSGDLLVVFGDALTRCWKQIIYFGREHAGNVQVVEHATWRSAPPAAPAMETPVFQSGQLVSDERGVRVARTQETSD